MDSAEPTLTLPNNGFLMVLRKEGETLAKFWCNIPDEVVTKQMFSDIADTQLKSIKELL